MGEPVLIKEVLPGVLRNILKQTERDKIEDEKRERKLQEQRSSDSIGLDSDF